MTITIAKAKCPGCGFAAYVAPASDTGFYPKCPTDGLPLVASETVSWEADDVRENVEKGKGKP